MMTPVAGVQPEREITRRGVTPTHLPEMTMALVVVLWGLGPPLTKLITAPPVVGVLYRFVTAIPILFLLLAATGRRFTKESLRVTALPGIGFGVNLLIVFAAVQEATIAVLSVTVSLQPALVLIVAGRWMNERPTAYHVAWTLVGVGGTIIVILGAGDELRASALGVIYAVGALLTFTAYFLVTRLARADDDVDPVEWVTGINIWAVAIVAPASLVLTDRAGFAEFGGTDWIWLAIITLGTGVAGHVLMGWVHRYIEASRSSLYLLLMHPVAVGVAWPIHDEPVTLIQFLGGIVVLGAVAAVVKRPAAPPIQRS